MNKFKNNSHATNLESSQYLINSEDTVAVDDLRKQKKKKNEKKMVKKKRNQCKRVMPITLNEEWKKEENIYKVNDVQANDEESSIRLNIIMEYRDCNTKKKKEKKMNRTNWCCYSETYE